MNYKMFGAEMLSSIEALLQGRNLKQGTTKDRAEELG